MKQAQSIDAYISEYPKEVQALLETFRSMIKKAAPGAEEDMKYGIPTFRLHGRNLVHFGAFKNHVSFFPGASGVAEFKDDVTGYTVSKGTIQFPIDKRLPTALITKIVKFRVKEEELRKTAKKKK